VQICAKEDIDVPHQMLHYGGKELLDKLTVGGYNIHQEATLQLSGDCKEVYKISSTPYYYFLSNALDEHLRIDRSYYDVTQRLKSFLLGFFDSGYTDPAFSL
jgi:hypothetical protein